MTSKVSVMTDEGFKIGTDTSRRSAPLVIKSHFLLRRANVAYMYIVTKIKVNVPRYKLTPPGLYSLLRLNRCFG